MKDTSIKQAMANLRTLIKQECGSDCEIHQNDDQIEVLLENPLKHRMMLNADARAVDGEEDIVELSFSSEEPVKSYWRDAPEILSHEPDAVDFKQFKKIGSVLVGHNPNLIAGAPTEVWLDAKARKMKMKMRFGTTDEAQKAKQEVLIDKTLKGVSVGYEIKKLIYLEDKNTSYKNRITGPAWVGIEWKPFEVSLTPIPADGTVGINRNKQQEGIMKDDPKTIKKVVPPIETKAVEEGSPGKVDPKTVEVVVSDEQKVQIAKEERTRVKEIMQLCRTHGVVDEVEDWIGEGVGADEVKTRILNKIEKENPPAGNISGGEDGRETFARAMSEGLQLRAKVIDPGKDEHGGRDFVGFTLLEMARECLSRVGISTGGMDKRELVKLALRGPVVSAAELRGAETIAGSSSDFPYILASTANKKMIGAAVNTPTTWRLWCASGSLSDFKATPRIKMSEAGDLELILEGKGYPSTNFSESQETLVLATYGKKFTITRVAIINDDMSAFTTIPARLGRAAARLPNQLAVVVLLSNPVMNDGIALFAGGHNNLSGNAGRALDTLSHAEDGLKNGINVIESQQVMMSTTEADKSHTSTLGLRARVCLCNSIDKFIARQALKSAGSLEDDKNAGVINPLKDENIAVVSEPMISDSNVTGYSTTAWYLFGDIADAPIIEVAFLNGNESPYMEELDQTDVDGRVFKVRQDCVADVIDYAGAMKESGA